MYDFFENIIPILRQTKMKYFFRYKHFSLFLLSTFFSMVVAISTIDFTKTFFIFSTVICMGFFLHRKFLFIPAAVIFMSFFMGLHTYIPLKKTSSETLSSVKKRVLSHLQQNDNKKILPHRGEITITGGNINLVFRPENIGFEVDCPSAEKKFSKNSTSVSLQKNGGTPCFLTMGKNTEISHLIINGSNLKVSGKRPQKFNNIELSADRIHIPADFSSDRIAIKGETVSFTGKIHSKNAVFFGENLFISGEISANSIHMNGSRVNFTATIFKSENLEIIASSFSGILKYGDSWTGKRHLSVSGVKEKMTVSLPENAGSLEIDAENSIEKELCP